MSGVLGVIRQNHHTDVSMQIRGMIDQMSYLDWIIAEHQVFSPGIALGRMGINIFNKAPQPIMSNDNNLALFMAGEIYNQAELSDPANRNMSCEKFILEKYQQQDTQIFSSLRGAFVVTIFDKIKNQIILANDYMGLYPTYISFYKGNFVFAPEMKAILSLDDFERRPDLTALAQYMRFQHLLGERSFFEDISLLPPASILTYDLGSHEHAIQTYWSFEDFSYRENITFEEAVEEGSFLLKQAISRLSEDEYKPGVFLSGGLDSRAILDFCERRPINTVTYGHRHCSDVYYARKIAKAAGANHHWFDMENGKWVLDTVDLHMDLTEGLHSWIHSHGMHILPETRKLMDVNLIGWCGGTMMGDKDTTEILQSQAVNDIALLNRQYYLFSNSFTWPSITEGEEQLLYHPEIWKKMQGLAFDSFREESKRFKDVRKDIRGTAFYVRNSVGRLTKNMVTFQRGFIEVRFPFFDHDLAHFIHSTPPEIRGDKSLYKAIIEKKLRRTALIPNSNDGLLPIYSPRLRRLNDIVVKSKRRVNKYCKFLFKPHKTLYADYEEYLRTDLQKWAEDILYSPELAKRNIFNPEFVKTLMLRHLSRNEEWTIGKIAPIITYEMMLRKLYDQT